MAVNEPIGDAEFRPRKDRYKWYNIRQKTGDEMSKIFDNIETKFEEGLHAILTNVGVKRAAFCVYENSGAVDHAGILKGGH